MLAVGRLVGIQRIGEKVLVRRDISTLKARQLLGLQESFTEHELKEVGGHRSTAPRPAHGVHRFVASCLHSQAYRVKALENHPDRHAEGEKAKAANAFCSISEAYAVLSRITAPGSSKARADSRGFDRANAERLFWDTFRSMPEDELMRQISTNAVGRSVGLGR